MASKTDTKQRGASPPKAGLQARASVDPKSDGPLYLQVVRALKDEIVSGVYPVGSQLPTEEELCERFSVSRYTVREALRRLRAGSLPCCALANLLPAFERLLMASPNALGQGILWAN